MGHVHLGRLPSTKRWQQVVALLSAGAPVEQIAGASAEAAENSLEHARNDLTGAREDGGRFGLAPISLPYSAQHRFRQQEACALEAVEKTLLVAPAL